jgi:hypothetical protein
LISVVLSVGVTVQLREVSVASSYAGVGRLSFEISNLFIEFTFLYLLATKLIITLVYRGAARLRLKGGVTSF